MNYGNIKYYDIANGPGVRTSLFVSGCNHKCKGCFNPETWDFNYGKIFDENVENIIINSCRPEYITGLTILGGEPMEPDNQVILLKFLTSFHKELPNKSIWCYTGCTYEELTGEESNWYKCNCTIDFLSLIDVLVDGQFNEDLKDISLRFRGSSNQRIIDVKESMKNKSLVLWEDDPYYIK